MRLGTAIERLVDNYRYASDKDWIMDKVAWALYQTWKEADRKTELQTTDYCDICNHKGCDNCIADGNNPYCVPSHYEPKDEPQTCSFSDCDNFKNPDYERCIECKRKQIKLKTEQTERSSE